VLVPEHGEVQHDTPSGQHGHQQADQQDERE
jgi:hypothetical protein